MRWPLIVTICVSAACAPQPAPEVTRPTLTDNENNQMVYNRLMYLDDGTVTGPVSRKQEILQQKAFLGDLRGHWYVRRNIDKLNDQVEISAYIHPMFTEDTGIGHTLFVGPERLGFFCKNNKTTAALILGDDDLYDTNPRVQYRLGAAPAKAVGVAVAGYRTGYIPNALNLAREIVRSEHEEMLVRADIFKDRKTNMTFDLDGSFEALSVVAAACHWELGPK